MQGKGPMRLEDVIAASGLQARYVEEWLKGMASAGYLDYDPQARCYALSEEHAYFLASEGTDHFAGGMFEMVPVLLRVAPQVAEAFAKGGGVAFEEFGPQCVGALDLINRGQYEHRFTSYWLQALPEAVAKLQAGGRMLDVGCGSGRVCAAFAQAFPSADITGIDPDPESIRRAKALGARAAFKVATAGALLGERFDLITLCDCVHDLAEPAKTLREVHALLEPDGHLFIVEPKAADRLEDNHNPVATMFYGFSIFHCMTQSLARGGPGLGTCMGPAAAERLVREAGFTRFEVLPVKSQVNLFYAARP
ncbi:MAG TPA: class I SAM-dependent methyltransferase [Burkholderiales bacterium]|nr:class I SAM-dependent methyltransferase [Burkholderiales bacterium]